MSDSRFVIQEHRTTPLHWDLMLEKDGVLKTWSLASRPPAAGPFAIPALQHFDHRLLYLTHEGEISGGRGTVRIVERGTYAAEWGDRRIALTLSGERLKGAFLLEFAKEGQRPEWILRTFSEPLAFGGVQS